MLSWHTDNLFCSPPQHFHSRARQNRWGHVKLTSHHGETGVPQKTEVAQDIKWPPSAPWYKIISSVPEGHGWQVTKACLYNLTPSVDNSKTWEELRPIEGQCRAGWRFSPDSPKKVRVAAILGEILRLEISFNGYWAHPRANGLECNQPTNTPHTQTGPFPFLHNLQTPITESPILSLWPSPCRAT